MRTPGISVIIPVFNTRLYLAECLESVLRQTLDNVEVIGVDNGSNDGSYELLQEYARRYPQLKVLQHIGGRQGAARNAGLDIAQGAYVGFVDSDDFVAPTMFEAMYGKARASGADIAVCNFNSYQDGHVGRTPGLAGELLEGREPFIIEHRAKLLRNLTPWNKIFSRRLVYDHKLRFPEGIYHEDVLFTLEALLLAQGVVGLPEPLYFYRRQREGSVNLYRGEGNLHIFRVMQMVTQFLRNERLEDRYARLLGEIKVTRILWSWKQVGCKLRRVGFQQMRAEFQEIELPELLRILTHTECREFRVIRGAGYAQYRLFGMARWLYGKLLALPGLRSLAQLVRASPSPMSSVDKPLPQQPLPSPSGRERGSG